MSLPRQIFKEPLLHFLIIGAALFGAYAWVNRGASEQGGQQVRLAEADVKWLKDTFALEHQREPTPEEVRDLVRGLLKEELFAREAQERGLDKDDIVVRRRLALRTRGADRAAHGAQARGAHPGRVFRVEEVWRAGRDAGAERQEEAPRSIPRVDRRDQTSSFAA